MNGSRVTSGDYTRVYPEGNAYNQSNSQLSNNVNANNQGGNRGRNRGRSRRRGCCVGFNASDVIEVLGNALEVFGKCLEGIARF